MKFQKYTKALNLVILFLFSTLTSIGQENLFFQDWETALSEGWEGAEYNTYEGYQSETAAGIADNDGYIQTPFFDGIGTISFYLRHDPTDGPGDSMFIAKLTANEGDTTETLLAEKITGTDMTHPGWTKHQIVINDSIGKVAVKFTVDQAKWTRMSIDNISATPFEYYSITTRSLPESSGNIENAGLYQQGDSAKIIAQPASGFKFVAWTEDSSKNSLDSNYVKVAGDTIYSFVADSNRNLVANFIEEGSYRIFAQADPVEGGEIYGEGDYQEGTTSELRAETNIGYKFVGWIENNLLVSADPSYSFTVNENRSLVARFEKISFLSFLPSDDSYIEGGSSSNRNHGFETELRSVYSDYSQYIDVSYIQFDLGDQDFTAVKDAELSLFCSKLKSPGYIYFYKTQTGWMEETLNWDNAPGEEVLVDSLKITSAGQQYVFDMTSLVNESLTDGNGIISLRLEEKDGNRITFNSKEADNNKPKLLLVVQPESFSPVADAYIQGGGNSSINFGSEQVLKIQQNSQDDLSMETYLSFDLSNESYIGLDAAKLRLYASSVAESDVILSVYDIDGNWSEEGIDGDNAPAKGQLIDSLLISNSGKYYEWDVSDFAQETYLNNSGNLNFVLSSQQNTNNPIDFNSKEASDHQPVLLVTPARNFDSYNAGLDKILINGKEVGIPEPGKHHYVYHVPYNQDEIPQITAVPSADSAEVSIQNAVTLEGDSAQRTAIINVTAYDGETVKEYSIEYRKMTEMDIFFFIGQSNMAGRGEIEDQDREIVDDAYLFKGLTQWVPAENPMNAYSNVRKALDYQKLNPAYTCARTITGQLPDKQIGLVVNARGGSSISLWGKGATLYEKSLERIKAAMKYGTIKAILWHQGESDRSDDNYMNRLKDMVNAFRTDLGNDSLFFVAGQLGRWRSDSKTFNENLTEIAQYIDHADYVISESLTPINGDLSDPHFDAKSQRILGKRYAIKVLESVYNTKIVSDSRLSSLMINGEAISGFEPDSNFYRVEYTGNAEELPEITALSYDSLAQVEITQVRDLSGNEEARTATIHVLARDGSVGTYKVLFASNDTRLLKIEIDGTPLHDYHPDNYSYTFEWEGDASATPQVTAVANDENAQVEIDQATDIIGDEQARTAVITVTAESGSRQKYEVLFLSATSLLELEYKNSELIVSCQDQQLIVHNTTDLKGKLRVFDMMGRCIHFMRVQGNSKNFIPIDKKGLYVVSFNSLGNSIRVKVVFY